MGRHFRKLLIYSNERENAAEPGTIEKKNRTELRIIRKNQFSRFTKI